MKTVINSKANERNRNTSPSGSGSGYGGYGRQDRQGNGTDGWMDKWTEKQADKQTNVTRDISSRVVCVGGRRHSWRVLAGVPLHPPPPSESDALALQ